jgi:hypothetical protein
MKVILNYWLLPGNKYQLKKVPALIKAEIVLRLLQVYIYIPLKIVNTLITSHSKYVPVYLLIKSGNYS